jgi:hypothetical protein
MEIKEIEIDSTYRNRVLYPNPCFFELLVNTPNKTFFAALDPVSRAAPQCLFTGNTLDSSLPNITTLTGTIVRVLPNAIEVNFSNQIFNFNNYYDGLTSDDNVTIVKYEYMHDNLGRFFLEKFPIVSVGNFFNIYYWPQIQPLNIAGLYVKFFIPAKPRCNQVKFLYNETRHNWNEIIYSDNVSVTVFIKNTNWNYSDRFSLRDEPPSWIGTIVSNTQNTITLNVVDSSQRDFIFIPSIGYFGKITNQNGLMITVTPNILVPILVNSEIQCLPFSYDNSQSLPYIGTCDQQQRTWIIELVSIQIPNVPLKNKFYLLQFSHLYVEFRDPYNSPQNNIMSNNPNSNNSYFRIIPNKVQSSREWLSFDCDGSSKTIRFTPTSMQFRFKILTPDGCLLEFIEKDSEWPKKSLSKLQVSALFNLKMF